MTDWDSQIKQLAQELGVNDQDIRIRLLACCANNRAVEEIAAFLERDNYYELARVIRGAFIDAVGE